MNGLKSSTTTQISYVAFFVLWTLPIACLALASPGLVSRLIRQAGLAGIRPDEASHQLTTLAAFWLITAAMFTYMLINLAVIEANAEDSFVVPPDHGGPAMCPADECMPCKVFVPIYFGCIAGSRYVATVILFCLAMALLMNAHPAPAVLGKPLARPLAELAPVAGDGGALLVVAVLWLAWLGPGLLLNSGQPTAWPYDGSVCLHPPCS